MKKFLTLLIIAIQFGVIAQEANDILSKVVTKLNTVNDYTVIANVKANIPMIKILPSKATIYFKQKDKFKVVSKGIVILPKQGFTEINGFLANKKSYLAVSGDSTKIAGVMTKLINTDLDLIKKFNINSKRSKIDSK